MGRKRWLTCTAGGTCFAGTQYYEFSRIKGYTQLKICPNELLEKKRITDYSRPHAGYMHDLVSHRFWPYLALAPPSLLFFLSLCSRVFRERGANSSIFNKPSHDTKHTKDMAELLSKPFYRVAKSLLPHAKRVYSFKEGGADDATLLGLKGANLCEMSRVGLPVPNGFVITTDACAEFLAQPDPRALSDEILSQINNHIRTLERSTGRYFGVDAKDKPRSLTTFPLLLSVRASVATADMPGLMGTILNLGLNPDVLDVIIRVTCNPRFGYDLYRRFLQMWGTVSRRPPHEFLFITDLSFGG